MPYVFWLSFLTSSWGLSPSWAFVQREGRALSGILPCSAPSHSQVLNCFYHLNFPVVLFCLDQIGLDWVGMLVTGFRALYMLSKCSATSIYCLCHVASKDQTWVLWLGSLYPLSHSVDPAQYWCCAGNVFKGWCCSFSPSKQSISLKVP